MTVHCHCAEYARSVTGYDPATGTPYGLGALTSRGLAEWNRPWTIVDYAGVLGIALAVGGLALVFWNPVGPYGRYTRKR